ncbi:MAG: PAS domain-containing protein [Persicimonas sp.]
MSRPGDSTEGVPGGADQTARTEREKICDRSGRALMLAGVGTWRADFEDGRFHFDAAEGKLLGVGEEVRELSFEEVFDRVHPEDRDRVVRAFGEARDGDGEVRVEHRLIDLDGSERWVEAHSEVLFDESGRAVDVAGVHVDITERKEIDRRLERLEQWRILSVEAAEVGDWEYDVVAQRAYWSPKALEQMGLEEPTEHFVDGIVPIHEKDRQAVLDAIDRALDPDDEEDLYQAEFRLVRNDGTTVWVESRGHAIFEETTRGRRPLRLIGAMVDVTERKQAEEELRENRRRLATLMSNLPGMAYRCLNEPHWPMTFVSRGCEELCGYPADLLVSGDVSWDSLIHPDDRQWLWEAVQQSVERRERFEVEYRIEHADGTQLWMWEQGCGVFEEATDDEPLALEGFITDVTARKEAERELRRVDERKNHFLAMLGHELRNPLMAISSAADLLGESPDDTSLAERAHGIISRQSRQMGRLIDGLLDLSRVTRGKLHLETEHVDLVRVLCDLLDDRRPQLEERHVVLSVDNEVDEAFIEADPVRISQIFDNLLSNAVRFTEADDRIELELSRSNASVEVVVRDTGAGIEQKDIEHIFEPFQQGAEDQAGPEGGLGLGLALARQLVELHGGEISARSEGPGRGSEFIVRLPLGAGKAAEEIDDRQPLACRRVLLVEDHRDIADLLSLQLERAGLEVATATTARDGLHSVRREDFDVVLCDLGLPDTSGFDFARRLRTEVPRDQVALVSLTGYGDEETRRRAEKAGFEEHLVKPIDIDELLDVLKRICPPSDAMH